MKYAKRNSGFSVAEPADEHFQVTSRGSHAAGPRTRILPPLPPRAVVAALMLICAGLIVLPGQAQATTPYVSNSTHTTPGTSFTANSSNWQASGFRTGSQSGGYDLGSVGIFFSAGKSDTTGMVVRIRTSSSNNPGSIVYTLTNPASYSANEVAHFNAPSGASLSAGTDYFVTMENTSTSASWTATNSGNEDSGKSAGWNIRNERHYRAGSGGSWDGGSGSVPLALAIYPIGDNNPASGTPEFIGTPQVGVKLSAKPGTIADDDGLPTTTYPTGYTFQWIRVDGATETDISGATDMTYTPVAADEGKKVKVKVGFTDQAGNDESLTSAAYPSSGSIEAQEEGESQLLVSNFDATYDANVSQVVGSSAGDQFERSQAFTTGSGTATVTSVEVDIRNTDNLNFDPTVSIYTDASGSPGTIVGTLTDPASNVDGLNTFTHSGISLAANTTYHVVIGAASVAFGARHTASGDEDADVTAGWTMADTHHRVRNGGSWESQTRVLRIGISGTWTPGEGGDSEALISNVGQTPRFNANLGGTRSAQSFTTGTNSGGYTLTSIDIDIFEVQSPFSASVCEVGGDGYPTSTCTNLTSPGTLTTGVNTFTAPADFTLLANTSYAVRMNHTNGAEQYATTSNDEDTGGSSGWSIGDAMFVASGGGWTTAGNSYAIRIAVNGTAISGGTNVAATGAPQITGTAQVRRTLTATRGNIADPDGLTTKTFPDDYTFQWIRVASGGTESVIPGAIGRRYTLVPADEGNNIKVRVNFFDDDGFAESLTSAAFPSTGRYCRTP